MADSRQDARLWWLTKIPQSDGDFYAMLNAGCLPSGSLDRFERHESLTDALKTIERAYQRQSQGLARINGKPKIWTAVA